MGGGGDNCGRNKTQLVVTLNGCWSTLVKTQLVMKCTGISQCFRGTKPACGDVRRVLTNACGRTTACGDVRRVLTNACGETQLVVTSGVRGSMLVEKNTACGDVRQVLANACGTAQLVVTSDGSRSILVGKPPLVVTSDVCGSMLVLTSDRCW